MIFFLARDVARFLFWPERLRDFSWPERLRDFFGAQEVAFFLARGVA